MEKYCRICGVSSKETPLTVYANEDFTKWLYLCKQCHERLIARTGGIIPLSLFRSEKNEQWEGERENNWLPARKGMNFSRTAIALLER